MMASPLPRYSMKQVLELLVPSAAALTTAFVVFADFRGETRGDIKLLKQAQDVVSGQVKTTTEQIRRQRDDMHGTREKLATIDERTKNTAEQVSETKALILDLSREIRNQRNENNR